MPNTITGVTFTGTPANPTITITGTGFGPAPTPTVQGFPGFTGFDYGDNLYIVDMSPTHGFSAGRGVPGLNMHDLIGLVLLTFTDTKIVYQLGNDYSLFYYPNAIYQLNPGDTFTVVTDAVFTGTVSYTPAVPEPGTLVMMASGLLGVAGALRRRLMA